MLMTKVIVFLGPPGSGKGTQAARLSSVLQIPAISTGEILRCECESGSELGRAVRAMLSSGQLVSDELMNAVVAKRTCEADCAEGFILDGYPRTASQAQFLDELLSGRAMPKPTVIHFVVSARSVTSRLERRRQCARCGRIVSVQDPRKGDFSCELDGAPLIRRADDHARAIRERLRLYDRNAKELIRYYQAQSYHRVQANGSPEAVGTEILQVLNVNRSAMLPPRAAMYSARAAY